MLEKIKTLCKSKGITLSKMEADLGFGSGYISKLDKSSPSVKNVQKIADYLEIAINDLLNQEAIPEVEDGIGWLEELENLFNGLVSSLGVVDIGTMKQIVKVSEHIEDARSYFEDSRGTVSEDISKQ